MTLLSKKVSKKCQKFITNHVGYKSKQTSYELSLIFICYQNSMVLVINMKIVH